MRILGMLSKFALGTCLLPVLSSFRLIIYAGFAISLDAPTFCSFLHLRPFCLFLRIRGTTHQFALI
jgi:hypothetical protein